MVREFHCPVSVASFEFLLTNFAKRLDRDMFILENVYVHIRLMNTETV